MRYVFSVHALRGLSPAAYLTGLGFQNPREDNGRIFRSPAIAGSQRQAFIRCHAVGSLAAPKDLHRILGEDPVGRQQDQLLQLGLGNQHPIKRIVVIGWQLANRKGMEMGDLRCTPCYVRSTAPSIGSNMNSGHDWDSWRSSRRRLKWQDGNPAENKPALPAPSEPEGRVSCGCW